MAAPIPSSFASFLLQLDFDHNGSLESPAHASHFRRPLTGKAHNILQTGGIDTFGMLFRDCLFASRIW